MLIQRCKSRKSTKESAGSACIFFTEKNESDVRMVVISFQRVHSAFVRKDHHMLRASALPKDRGRCVVAGMLEYD